MSEPAANPRQLPRPALTVDVVVVRRQPPCEVLLIRRKNPPFAGCWALPGGFVDENEPLEAAARRELFEETGIQAAELTQIGAFGDPGRDPRGWTVSVAYLAWIQADNEVSLAAGDDAADAQWHPLDQLPPLAFDHGAIVQQAISKCPAINARSSMAE